jgi:hypothetical protein
MTQSPASVVDTGTRSETAALAFALQNDEGNADDDNDDDNDNDNNEYDDEEINQETLLHGGASASRAPFEGASFLVAGGEGPSPTLRAQGLGVKQRRRSFGVRGGARKASKASGTPPLQPASGGGVPKNWSCALLEKKVRLLATGEGGEVCAVIDKGWIQVRLASGRKVKSRPGQVEVLEIPSDEAAEAIATFASKTKSLQGSSTLAVDPRGASLRGIGAARKQRRNSNETLEEALTPRASSRRQRQRAADVDDDYDDEGSEGACFEEGYDERSYDDEEYLNKGYAGYVDRGYAQGYGNSLSERCGVDTEDAEANEGGRALVAESFKLMQAMQRVYAREAQERHDEEHFAHALAIHRRAFAGLDYAHAAVPARGWREGSGF